MKDYSKYINSTGTHYISNSGSDENGNLHDGKAGDQTGKEWQLRSWYKRPWTCVLRHPDARVRSLFAELSCAAALNNNIGYDQYQRYTYLTQLEKAGWNPEKITTPCEEDCTAGVTANMIAVGHLLGITALKKLDKTIRSSVMRKQFAAAGFQVLTESKYINGYDYLVPGDVLLYDNHHAAANITKGKHAMAEYAPVQTAPLSLGDRILKNGMAGDDVKELQTRLIACGFSCGSWGADGDFGDATEIAVKNFQRKNGCDVDGHVGPQTLAALEKAYAPVAKPKQVKIVGGNCYIRNAPGIDGECVDVAVEGIVYPYGGETAENGWNSIVTIDGAKCWVSGKYSKLV